MSDIKFADDVKGIDIQSEADVKAFNTNGKINRISREKQGIGVIKTADIKTSNTLIGETQKKVKKEQKNEEIRVKRANSDYPYIANNLLTNAEKQLFNFMSENLCQVDRIHIFPKVRLADIIQVDNKLTTDKDYLWKITNKHVDFLLCRKSDMGIICVVELDDYTHETQEAQDRDIFVMSALYAAGIKTARVRCKISTIDINDLRFIDDCINNALAPACPECGLPMIPRQDRKGKRFYACSDYKNCRKTISIDTQGEKLP